MMELIAYNDYPASGSHKFVFSDGEQQLEVTVTPEGVIMDAWELVDGNLELVGTTGRMADEWFNHIKGEKA